MGKPMGDPNGPGSLAAVVAWLHEAPAGITLDRSTALAMLEPLLTTHGAAAPPTPDIAPSTWKERIWGAPAETRIGVAEVAEAMGRSKSWVYHRVGQIPHRKLDGELVFVVGELRLWIRDNEETIVAGRTARPDLTLSRA
jgi:hypothetical protein